LASPVGGKKCSEDIEQTKKKKNMRVQPNGEPERRFWVQEKGVIMEKNKKSFKVCFLGRKRPRKTTKGNAKRTLVEQMQWCVTKKRKANLGGILHRVARWRSGGAEEKSLKRGKKMEPSRKKGGMP